MSTRGALTRETFMNSFGAVCMNIFRHGDALTLVGMYSCVDLESIRHPPFGSRTIPSFGQKSFIALFLRAW